MTTSTPYQTASRRAVLRLLNEHGEVSARGLIHLDGETFRTRQYARSVLRGGVAAGLWQESTGAPGVYRLPVEEEEPELCGVWPFVEREEES